LSTASRRTLAQIKNEKLEWALREETKLRQQDTQKPPAEPDPAAPASEPTDLAAFLRGRADASGPIAALRGATAPAPRAFEELGVDLMLRQVRAWRGRLGDWSGVAAHWLDATTRAQVKKLAFVAYVPPSLQRGDDRYQNVFRYARALFSPASTMNLRDEVRKLCTGSAEVVALLSQPTQPPAGAAEVSHARDFHRGERSGC
jgi:hypothetical protein